MTMLAIVFGGVLLSSFLVLQCEPFVRTSTTVSAIAHRKQLIVQASPLSILYRGVSSRVQKIKDISLQKDILKDITASEFALRLEVKQKNAEIDFDMLISKLDKNLEKLAKKETSFFEPLIERLKSTKEKLLNLKQDTNRQVSKEMEGVVDENSTALSDVDESILSFPTNSVRVQELRESLRLIVREDGTVDWDGALASSKEVAKFGSELWERLNGKEEEFQMFGQVQAKVPETEDILRLTIVVKEAQQSLDAVIAARDELKAKLRDARKRGLSIPGDDVASLGRLDLRSKELEKRLKLFSLDLDMEKICVYLHQEIELSVEANSELRVFVAQVALVDKQLSGMLSGLQVELASMTEGGEPLDVNADYISLVDDDELNLIRGEVNDLLTRLGISQTIVAMDWGSLGVVASETISKFKEGLAFYGQGTRMLVADVQYAWQLLLKAARGVTLKPREVNSVRRTGKDLLTLIPFIIILIIPLSPVGHVLVFSFIQKSFPDFFPSFFTEKRLKLRRLFSEIERKDLDQIIGPDPAFVWPPVADPNKFFGSIFPSQNSTKPESRSPSD